MAAAALIGVAIFDIENPNWIDEQNPLYREGMFVGGSLAHLLAGYVAFLSIARANEIKNDTYGYL